MQHLFRFRNFPQETQLWHEVKTYSDALQSEASDEKTVFYKSYCFIQILSTSYILCIM